MRLFLISTSMALIACGGGGGRPGECRASAEVCGTAGTAGAAASTGSTSSPANTPTPLVDQSRVALVTCADMTSLSQALAYLAAGATQLDADHDGKPCEDNFPGQ